MLREIAATHAALVTLEENVVAGGAGSACSGAARCRRIHRIPRLHIGIPDRFIEHGSRDDCLVAAGLDPPGIAATIERWRATVPGLKLGRGRHQISSSGPLSRRPDS